MPGFPRARLDQERPTMCTEEGGTVQAMKDKGGIGAGRGAEERTRREQVPEVGD